jgi:vitamin B12 transporter
VNLRSVHILTLVIWFIYGITASTSIYAQEPVTIHGTSIEDSEDPNNSTATTEVIAIDGVEPTLGAVLENATGIGIQRGGNLGRSEFIQLRGTLGHQAQIRLEGIPLLFLQGQSINLSALPIALFDTVRITRGGSSVDYGSGAQGGVVHLSHDPRKPRLSSASLRVGSFGYRRLSGLVPISRGHDHMSIGLQLEHSDGNFDFVDFNERDRTRQNNHHNSANFFALGRWKLKTLGTLKLLLDTYSDRRGEPGPMEFPNLNAHSETKRVIAGLNLKLTPMFHGRLSTNMLYFAQLRNLNFSDPAPSFVGDPKGFYMTDQSLCGAMNNRFQLSPELLIGANIETQRTQVITRDSTRSRHQRTLSSLSTHAEWQANQALHITVGSRIQQGFQAKQILPRVGSTLQLPHRLMLNANLSKFFRLPSLDELYFRGVGVAGNPNLTPEKGYSADLGLVWTPGHRLLNNVSLHGFATHFDSLIFFAPIDAYRFQTKNHPGGLILGTEFMVRATVLDSTLNLSHRYQASQSEAENTLPLPYRPAHLLRARASHSIGALTVKLSATQISEQTIDIYGRRQLDGYSEVDLRLDFRLNQRWLTSVTGMNLLDEKNHRDFPTLPRPGRTLLFLLSLTSI